jgi:hypothetical protein
VDWELSEWKGEVTSPALEIEIRQPGEKLVFCGIFSGLTLNLGVDAVSRHADREIRPAAKWRIGSS